MSSDASSRASSPEVAAPSSSSSKKRKPSLPELEVDISLPEPPSKKAKRMLKKGKPLPPSKNADSDKDGDDDKKPDDDLDLPDKPARSQQRKKGGKDAAGKEDKEEVHGVWIGNLPFTLTRPELFQWLVDASGGSIPADSVTRVNLPTSKKVDTRRQQAHHFGPPGSEKAKQPTVLQNKGFAYVDFSTFDACVAAIALSETEFAGRKLLIKNSKSFEGRPAPGAASAADGAAAAAAVPANTSRKIFVGNLGFATTEDDLWAHFDKCGEIEWVKVATFQDTGKCKGYGWVKFKEADAAAGAVKGFVRIKEEIETEEDFIDKEEGANDNDDKEGGDEDEEEEEKPKKEEAPKRTKMRKWWVNMLRGRPLKIQFAEDDQTRYKKRFGKDAVKKDNAGGQETKGQKRDEATPPADEQREAPRQERPPRKEKGMQYADDINVARLTGGAVAPQGKKTTFE